MCLTFRGIVRGIGALEKELPWVSKRWTGETFVQQFKKLFFFYGADSVRASIQVVIICNSRSYINLDNGWFINSRIQERYFTKPTE